MRLFIVAAVVATLLLACSENEKVVPLDYDKVQTSKPSESVTSAAVDNSRSVANSFKVPAKGAVVTFRVREEGKVKKIVGSFHSILNEVVMIRTEDGQYLSYKRLNIAPSDRRQFFEADFLAPKPKKRSEVAVSRSTATQKAPRHIEELFKEEVIKASGKKANLADLKGKYLAIYFSAHWCPPCRQFTPQLVKFRNSHKNKFEVVFVSSDQTLAARGQYISKMKMPWLMAKFKGRDHMALRKLFPSRGIPYLVVLDPKGKVVDKSAVSTVMSSRGGFPWR